MQYIARKIFHFLAFLIISIGFPKGVVAQGDLLIFPKRLEFQDTRDRIKILNLTNIGKDSATYQISYVNYMMREDGKFVKVEEPNKDQRFASPFLRFYPRTITLAPGESQIVKVQLIKTSHLQYGEYRSHLYFRSVPKVKEAEEILEERTGGLKIDLVPIYGLSIANIIRVGESNVEVSLSGLSLEKKDHTPLLNITFNRKGDFSCYGDIKVIYRSPQGQEKLVGEIQGIAVYTPGLVRKAIIELNKSDVDYSLGGELIVRYISQGADKKILAENTLAL